MSEDKKVARVKAETDLPESFNTCGARDTACVQADRYDQITEDRHNHG